MKYSNSFWILALFFATIKAQSCNQPTAFTIQPNGQPPQELVVNSDGSLCTANAANACDQAFNLCSDGSFNKFSEASKCAQTVCVDYTFSKVNGKMVLNCVIPNTVNRVSIIGFSNNAGYKIGNPSDAAGLIPVILQAANDPCGVFGTPLLAPVEDTGVFCDANTPCPSRYCCNSGFCGKCPSPAPAPTTPPPPPPFVFTPGKAGDLCSTTIPCEKGLCCLLANGGPLRRKTCQKCPSQGVPKPTPPKPTPPKTASGSCDSKTGKGCKFVDCANDGDCPSGMTCVAPEESGDSKVCYPTSTELGTERKLLGGNVGSYTESMASGDLNQFAAYDFAAKFAFGVYNSANKIISAGLCKPYKLVKFIEAAPFFAAVGIYQGDDHVVIAFRGTVNDPVRGPMNWFTNLNIFPRSFGRGAVAIGFFNAYDRISSDIFGQLSDMKFTSLTITGHSLGGALSQLLVMDMLGRNSERVDGRGYNIDSHITFGMPRAGSEAFQQDYENRMGSIRKAHFVAQGPKGRFDLVTEVSMTFSPIPGKLTIPVNRLGYISLHSGYQSTFNDWENKFVRSKGKCVNFNSVSSSAPPPGPSHGSPTPPKGPTPASGPKCTFKH